MSRARAGVVAILLLAAANALLVQRLGSNQTSHYALTRALSHGTAQIDPYAWETVDKTYVGGHFYANKPPGLAFASLPLYEAARLAHIATGNERVAVWGLGLVLVVATSFVLLLAVRALADAVEPGYGAVAAVTLGLGTLLLPFSSLFFAHALSALLGFGAFAVLWRERAGPPRLALVAAAGLLVGLAVLVEYPLGLIGGILLVYCCLRGPRLTRGGAYLGAAAAGALPIFLYNWWALGSPLHSTYRNVVFQSGRTGHDVVGNLGGVFGISVPDPRVALAVMLSPKGLLVLTPVVAVAAAGIVLVWRGGRRAEASVIAAVALAYLAYDAGFARPFGGDGPGPRYVIPMLPFLALPLAASYRRWPLTTGALAVISALLMLAATVTEPLIGGSDTEEWLHRLVDRDLVFTIFKYAGAGHGWTALIPFLVLVAGAAALAWRSVEWPAVRRGDARAAIAATAGWALLAATGHRLLRTGSVTGLPHSTPGALAAGALLAAVVGVVWLLAPDVGGEATVGGEQPAADARTEST